MSHIIYCGVDFHARQQTICCLKTETGELPSHELKHDHKEALRKFYSELGGPVIVGLKTSGYTPWFEQLLEELGHQVWLGELLELTGDHLLHDLQRSKKPFRETPIVENSGRSNLLADFLQDLRFALRMLLKNPGFTTVTVIALALGIGANTAIFSVVNTVLLRPLPYKDPERLVMVWEDASKTGHPRDTPTAANFIDWRNQNQVFEGMAAINEESYNLTGAGEPERLEGMRVSADLFPLLGVEPQLGRVFTAAEDQPGSQHVVLLSYGLLR